MPLSASRRHSRVVTAGLATVLIVCLSGCASSYKVQVNAIVSPEAEPATTYTLTPHDPRVPERDLYYPEICDRVRTAMAAKGMYEAATPEDADIVVEIEYGARPPRTKVTTVQQTSLAPPDPLGRDIDPLTGRPYPPGTITIGGSPHQRPYPGSGQYPGSGRMQTVTTTEERVTTVSEKYVRLSARENIKPRDPRTKRPAQVWIVEAIIEDERSDVHDCMPAMVNALTDYIGESSAGKVTLTVAAEG